jgi:hypothetical protein
MRLLPSLWPFPSRTALPPSTPPSSPPTPTPSSPSPTSPRLPQSPSPPPPRSTSPRCPTAPPPSRAVTRPRATVTPPHRHKLFYTEVPGNRAALLGRFFLQIIRVAKCSSSPGSSLSEKRASQKSEPQISCSKQGLRIVFLRFNYVLLSLFLNS